MDSWIFVQQKTRIQQPRKLLFFSVGKFFSCINLTVEIPRFQVLVQPKKNPPTLT